MTGISFHAAPTESAQRPVVVMALPSRGFDPTESGTTWHELVGRGVDVRFATPDGRPGAADPRLLDGVVFGQLGATHEAREHYREMTRSTAYQHPLRYADINASTLDGIVLPGGHAKEMRPYLEDTTLRAKVLEAAGRDAAIGAICHGVIVLSRTIDPATGRSLIADRTVTSLPKYLERSAWLATAWKLGDYYRTYPTYVEDEVRNSLSNPDNFDRGPAPWKPFALRDGNLVTARWPKDAALFANRFADVLEDRAAAAQAKERGSSIGAR